jgi:hypothetical protein
MAWCPEESAHCKLGACMRTRVGPDSRKPPSPVPNREEEVQKDQGHAVAGHAACGGRESEGAKGARREGRAWRLLQGREVCEGLCGGKRSEEDPHSPGTNTQLRPLLLSGDPSHPLFPVHPPFGLHSSPPHPTSFLSPSLTKDRDHQIKKERDGPKRIPEGGGRERERERVCVCVCVRAGFVMKAPPPCLERCLLFLPHKRGDVRRCWLTHR